ncbi:MAG: cell division protein ZapA [Rhodobacteraceae bacterium]|jgi:cell division protein ZapA|uniref:cell division protein ZapA n=1 Tax=Albidovulum sp. TaxID=1872424 RepID=UPI00265A0167|nr:cell division protein ZapA [uncultured Defluviimonas sp.]MCC0068585.1 cell division protein ZapA [Paracoccaceae bacterium]
MPEVLITIGGRQFEVACQDGEEHFLRSAARMLDAEASVLVGQIGRMPEARMLLMAGLMLADKTAGLEDQLRAAEERAVVAERVATNARANPERVEVPVIPQIVTDSFAEIAARAEALAARIEERAGA